MTKPANSITNVEVLFDDVDNMRTTIIPTTVLKARVEIFPNFSNHKILKDILKILKFSEAKSANNKVKMFTVCVNMSLCKVHTLGIQENLVRLQYEKDDSCVAPILSTVASSIGNFPETSVRTGKPPSGTKKLVGVWLYRFGTNINSVHARKWKQPNIIVK